MEKVQENKMGTMPVGPLLLNVSIPIVISMLVQALYNVVDSIFVARVSEDALTAVSLVFPIQNLMIAVGVGTAVGMSSLLSRRLGERNHESANRVATHGVVLALASTLLFVLMGVFFSELFFSSYAANPDVGEDVVTMGVDYMKIVTIASLGLFMSITFERLLQSTGRSVFSMISQMTGAIVNIILDPIMIFGLLGFPAMGVAGAALATVIGQWAGMLVGIFFNHTRNHEIKLQIKGFRLSLPTIRNIYKVGLPSIIMQSIGSVMVFAMNRILVGFGTTPVSVLGIYFKLQSFIFMPVIGFNNGMVPIVAYNYGARNRKRIEQAVRLTVMICFGIMVAGTLIFWLFPGLLLRMFSAEADMVEIGSAALRIISLSFPGAAVGIVFSGSFQALGQGMYSLFMSVFRQLGFLLPAAYLLARFFGLPHLWAAFPIAEIFSLFCAIFFFRRLWRNKIKPLDEKNKAAPAKETAATADVK